MKKFTAILLSLIMLSSLTCTFSLAADGEKSELPEVHITLADGLTIEEVNGASKDIKYSGNTVTLIDAQNSETVYEDVELKGRGNFTWDQPQMIKKPYQIKFSSKTDVFGMGKAKKWVLLANYADGTLMRNKLVFDLANKLNMPYTPECMWVDLYANGEYMGNYLLSEKVEIGSSRVDLEDDYGVLCEIDSNYGTKEDYYFQSALNNTVVVLKESVADDLGEENSVSETAFSMFEAKFNAFEAALYSEDTTWEELSTLIDEESFIKYYFIQELTENPDGCRSSVYLYTDGEEDIIHVGPIWDYDSALGNYTSDYVGGNPQVDYTLNIQSYMGLTSVNWFNYLFEYDEFEELALKIFKEEIKPAFATGPSLISSYTENSAFTLSAKNNFEKWNGLLGGDSVFGGPGHHYAETFEGEVEHLSQWLTKRIDYLNSRYVDKVIIEPEEKPTEPPAEEPSEEPSAPPENTQPNLCEYCGEEHSGFVGKIIQFFHNILIFFRNLF